MRTRSKRARAAKQAHAQLDTVKGRLRPAVESAAYGARDRGVLVVERVTPAVEAARDKAYETTRDRVVPAVHTARENVGPAVASAIDTAKEKAAPVVADARDKVVDDLLPRIAAGLAAASAAAITARDNAVESAQDAKDQAIASLPANKKKAKRKARRRRFLLFSVAVAAVGAGYAAFKARSAQEDPWTPGPATAGVNGSTYPTPAPVPAPDPTPVPVDSALPVVDPPVAGDPLTHPVSDDLADDPSVPAEEKG